MYRCWSTFCLLSRCVTAFAADDYKPGGAILPESLKWLWRE